MFSSENKPTNETAIEVENIGKCYTIYDKPRDRLLQMLSRGKKKYYREFWALHDISFTVKKGETIGIIGRNGSGKSTLLQAICGTLTPTQGKIRINGKIAALLELGAGFNPEFTGRENVYMAAALYGLTKNQIDERFDRIASFADIGSHIDQPVKSYSSGMFVRLAFAVIAHVDADILVIDEALAVGDAVFTQKCMRFIRAFKDRGTLLFVSHDISSVINLCQRSIWLHNGNLRQIGQSKAVSDEYLQYTLQEVYGDEVKLERASTKHSEAIPVIPDDSPVVDYEGKFEVIDNLDESNGWKTGAGEILSVRLEHESSNSEQSFQGGENVRMTIRAIAYQNIEKPIIGFLVCDRLGQSLFGENSLPQTDRQPLTISTGETFEAEFLFRLPMLPNGQYVVIASLAEGTLYSHVQHHWLHDALIINVFSSKVRWGLVGVPFQKISLKKLTHPQHTPSH
ncbi:ABC transporter ATP-binding protein [Pseudomonas schmalbachii]|uniref:ABC transporter ATP-binding protein n=1 Tax=Pseudomonas schmalbachii TaxID=2816993 RepID=A0ABS3TRE8_9PSED|nr:ABC transporter ATP-binding protein [Pseudomonas schmalbachii]MBO3276235.1 ABC transporter ATP-binding protein [Pseudomonas schmalbachii]